MKQEIEVEPLTRTTRAGEVLKRRPEVEEQIREILELEPDALISRLKVGFKDPAFVKHEAVVFLIRKYRKAGDDHLVNDLTTILIARLTHPIEKRIGFIAANLKDECRDEVITNVFRPILDISHDRADYAQVSFWPWFENRVADAVDKYFRIQKKEADTESLTREDKDGEDEVPASGYNFRVGDISNEEHSALVKDALSLLKDNEREAFLLRHYWGLEIQNRDSSVLTISKHFGVTPRTIRNWLNSAEEKIARWRDHRGA